MQLWIKDTQDKPSAILTFTTIGFFIVMFKVLLSGATVSIMGKVFNFGTIDAATIAAVLTPTLGAYVARRHTDRKFESADLAAVAPVAGDTK